HGLAFLLLLVGSWAVPAVRRWPWVWLVPFSIYFVLAVSVPFLRRSLGWFRMGAVSWNNLIATFGAMALTSLALVVFQHIAQPDLSAFRATLPQRVLGSVVLAGAVFAVLNAISEETVFRGILFDALESQWGLRGAVALTTLLFGLGHFRGYPPGLV